MSFLGIPTSRKDLGSAGWIKGAATGGARLTANLGSITGDKSGNAASLRNFADAVDDPNRGYSGTLNPYSVVAGVNSPSRSTFTFSQGQPNTVINTGQVAGANTGFDVNGNPLGGGAFGAGGGGADKYDPNLDPVKIQAQREHIRGLMGMFEQAYNDVLGQVDQLASSKRGEFEKNYADQRVGLDKNFGTTTTGIDDQYGARNAFDSSYRATAQGQAKDAYDAANTQLGAAENHDIASVGQFADQQKAELAGGRPTFNVDDYNQVDDLLGIGQDVQSAVNKLHTTGAGLGTDSQYLAHLNSIAPTKEQGSAQLKGMLDKLAMTGASNPDAKRAIAMSTIAKAGGDQSAWIDYFEKQMAQTGSNAVVDPAMAALQQ